MENFQRVKSFDDVTILKIKKGAVIALFGAFAVGLLLLAWNMDIERASIVAFIAWLVPFTINVVKEFLKGETTY
jgi:hypothetical protein